MRGTQRYVDQDLKQKEQRCHGDISGVQVGWEQAWLGRREGRKPCLLPNLTSFPPRSINRVTESDSARSREATVLSDHDPLKPGIQ